MTLSVCVFCLAENSSELRYDKTGKPYIICKLCMTRAFIRSMDALRGVAVAPELFKTAMDARKTDAAYRRSFDGKIIQLIREVAEKATEPAVVPQRGLAVGQKTMIPFVLGQE